MRIRHQLQMAIAEVVLQEAGASARNVARTLADQSADLLP